MALALQRTHLQRTAADPSVAPATIDDVQPADALITDDKEARAEALKNAAREAALARAREEEQQRWQELRRNQAFDTPMTEALQDAQVLQGTIKPPPSRAREVE
jgi:hypothetical protein